MGANLQKKLETAADEDDNDIANIVDEMSLFEGIRPVPGGPFSALTPSMWPQEILAKLGQPEVVRKNMIVLHFFINFFIHL